ncbi:MAG: alkaline phosphatase family protein [Nitrososphaerota archaeon]|nr:alkaline phosphatase family protein [Nitrososphaerota archaeon]
MPKVLVIGVDACDFNIANSLISRGLMPHIGKYAASYITKLRSTIPPNTAPSWTSAFTGVNPGKHGIFYFKEIDTGRVLSSWDNKVPYVWELLANVDMESIVVNVPLTYPVRKVRGVMVSGLHATRATSKSVFPDSLITSVKRNYEFDMWDLEWSSSFSKSPEATYDKLLEGDSSRVSFFCKLLGERRWDFATIVLTSLDRIQHSFWNFEKSSDSSPNRFVLNAYVKVDELIGKLLKQVSCSEDVSVFILSDHGFEGKYSVVHPNEILIREGLLVPERTNENLSQLARLGFGRVERIFPSSFAIPFGRMGRRLVAGILSSSVERGSMNMKSTVAFCIPYGMIRIRRKRNGDNVHNRDVIARRIKDAFESWSSKLHVRLEVLEGSNLYWGEEAQAGPDLVINPIAGCEFSSVYNQTVLVHTEEGDHSMNGILTFRYSDRQGGIGTEITNPRMWDLAATVLTILGIRPPSYFDGGPLVLPRRTEGLREIDLSHPEDYPTRSEYKSDEEAIIRKRLKDMGYE